MSTTGLTSLHAVGLILSIIIEIECPHYLYYKIYFLSATNRLHILVLYYIKQYNIDLPFLTMMLLIMHTPVVKSLITLHTYTGNSVPRFFVFNMRLQTYIHSFN